MKSLGKTICPVCHSAATRYIFTGYDLLHRTTNDDFKVFYCAKCKALFLNPLPSEKEIATFYPKTYYSYKSNQTSFFTRLKDDIIKNYFEPDRKISLKDKIMVKIFKNKFAGLPFYRKKNGRFLDVGCGSGENLKILNKYGWDTFGIEIDSKAIKKARKQKLNVQCTTLENLKTRGKFDAIRIWHVFEHLKDPNAAILKLSNLLKKDGEILMAVPNTNSFGRIFFRQYWYNMDVPRHIINYSLETLNYLFGKHHLVCSELKYASAGVIPGSISNFLRGKFHYQKNLIDNIFLVFLFYPLDMISDLLKKGDIIFLKIKKK